MTKELDFIALDVETANADLSSICQLGMARYRNGEIVEEWVSYIDPDDYFDPVNVSIHGIDESTVLAAPTYDEIHGKICQSLANQIVVTHTSFDRVSLARVTRKHEIDLPICAWMDSACVVRRTWKEYARRGYRLLNICQALNYEFEHHDALEDAKAAGFVMLAAMERSGLNLKEWQTRVKQPIHERISQNGNPEGPLYGETLVFTGSLQIPRYEAAAIAANVGCDIAVSVSKQSTILVVGDQDIFRLAGHTKSSKHRKAEELISKGFPIRILRESDFKELVTVTAN